MKPFAAGLVPGACFFLLSLFPPPARGVEAGSQSFHFRSGDFVVFAGGANFVQDQFEGYLETLLTAAHPGLPLAFRTMAWEADTVYRQERPLNFPGWEEQLAAVGASVVIAQFGQMESLDGREKLSDFTEAYEAILDTFSSGGRRIILVSPSPFEPFAGLSAAEIAARNENAGAYAAAIGRLAQARGYFFVDLMEALIARDDPPLTSDGVHLSPAGQREVADTIARKLGCAVRYSDRLRELRHAVISKNRLWFNFWRPTNWAFLHGDRTHVPSSRDHRDFEVRWFPAEMEQYRPLIRDAEARIQSLAGAPGRHD